MGDDGLAVANGFAVVDDIGQLPARRLRRIENMLVRERHAGKPQEGEHLQPVTVVVGNAEQLGVGVKRDHCIALERRSGQLRSLQQGSVSWPNQQCDGQTYAKWQHGEREHLRCVSIQTQIYFVEQPVQAAANTGSSKTCADCKGADMSRIDVGFGGDIAELRTEQTEPSATKKNSGYKAININADQDGHGAGQ